MSRKARKEYSQIRSELLARGFSIRAWAMAHSVPVGTAYNAIKGHRNGARAHLVRQKLHTYLNAHGC